MSRTKLAKLQSNAVNLVDASGKESYSDKEKWMPVTIEYTAKGNEKYLTIGNFKNNARTRKSKVKKRQVEQIAYYYLDNVSMVPISPSFKSNTTYVFENILFEFDEFKILTSEENQLNKVYRHLLSDSSLQIAIHGHTDNDGSQRYNAKLSKRRAQAVADYFIDKGISKNRIIVKGYGATKPIVKNSSEEGRKQNRRVAFIISKK